jgi:hypothetical protein
MEKYKVKEREWKLVANWKFQQWESMWWCDDGDGVNLYIENDKGGFELCCFSGIPASKIYIDVVDFGVLWHKAFENSKEIEPIQNYNYIQQCIILGDWLCGLFCTWTDISNYKSKD